MKKFYLLLMSMLLSLAALADDNGSCGDNVTYTFVEETGTLTISGTGEMKNYNDYSNQSPWKDYKTNIRNVEIQD